MRGHAKHNKRWRRSVLSLLLAGLTLTGCAAGGAGTERSHTGTARPPSHTGTADWGRLRRSGRSSTKETRRGGGSPASRVSDTSCEEQTTPVDTARETNCPQPSIRRREMTHRSQCPQATPSETTARKATVRRQVESRTPATTRRCTVSIPQTTRRPLPSLPAKTVRPVTTTRRQPVTDPHAYCVVLPDGTWYGLGNSRRRFDTEEEAIAWARAQWDDPASPWYFRNGYAWETDRVYRVSGDYPNELFVAYYGWTVSFYLPSY